MHWSSKQAEMELEELSIELHLSSSPDTEEHGLIKEAEECRLVEINQVYGVMEASLLALALEELIYKLCKSHATTLENL